MYLHCCLYMMPRRKRISLALSKPSSSHEFDICDLAASAEKTNLCPCGGQTRAPPRHDREIRTGHKVCRCRTRAWDPPLPLSVHVGKTQRHASLLWEVVQGRLICSVRFLEIILHKIAVACGQSEQEKYGEVRSRTKADHISPFRSPT